MFAIIGNPPMSAEELWFYCGCYTTRLGHVEGRGNSIGIYSLDAESGLIRHRGNSPPIVNSSHLCLGPRADYLYGISEWYEYQGKRDGYLTVFSRDRDTRQLHQIQTVSSHGPGPAYVGVDRSGKYLLLANYVAGNVVVYPIQDNGHLGSPTANIMHAGHSVNADRQEGPHPHAIVTSPDNRHVYVPDLGTDRIHAYQFDPSEGTLKPLPDQDVVAPAGSGPRHLVFSHHGAWAFVSLELSSEVLVLKYDGTRLAVVGRHTTLPAGYQGVNSTAEIRVSPDDRFVYVSNRGHNSISVFRIDDLTGRLDNRQTVSTQGEVPRNFGISMDGRWLVAANQNSHSLVSFRRNGDSGQLTPVHTMASPSPVLICFESTR
jgi:6-phosphogluconolactonase